MKNHQLLALAVLTAFGLAACEDALSAQVERSVFLAALPDRTLTIELPANGTVSPVGGQKVKQGEPTALQSAPASGYAFYHWEKVSGTGTVTFADDAKLSTTVRLTGGDAVVRAVFADTVFTVTVEHQAGGTTDRSTVPNLPQGVASSVITATADPDYHFVNWTVTTGTGLTFSPSTTSAAVAVTAASSDASIRANFARNTYTYSFDNLPVVSAGVTGAPASLNSGQTYPVSAVVTDTYLFDGWVKASGTGTATFASPGSATTSVTVTAPWAAAAAIQFRAKVRKEVLTLTAAGSLASPDGTTTYPADFGGAWYDPSGRALYIAGTGVASSGVIRRFGLASPNSVTTGNNDYKYLVGVPSALTSNGTRLYYATSSQIGALDVAGFGSGSSLTTRSLTGVVDLALEPRSSTLAVVGTTGVSLVSPSTLGTVTSQVAYQVVDGWSPFRVAAAQYALYTVYQDNGANLLEGTDVFAQGTSSTYAPHNGVDMDPGWAGKPSFDDAGEYFALPVQAPDETWSVQLYDGTSYDSVGSGPVASVSVGVSGSGALRSLSWVGPYLVASGNSGGEATLWIIDAYDLRHPVVRKNQAISGFTDAPYAFYDGATFWVVLDNTTSRIKIQGYTVTRS